MGFGIKGKYVVARYCESLGNVQEEVKENVFPIDGYKECSDLERTD